MNGLHSGWIGRAGPPARRRRPPPAAQHPAGLDESIESAKAAMAAAIMPQTSAPK